MSKNNQLIYILANIPDELIDLVFEYHNPHKENFKKVLFDLKWYNWWYIWINSFDSDEISFYKYIFLLLNASKKLNLLDYVNLKKIDHIKQ